MREQINNKKILEPYRKSLRKNLTPAEAFLWRLLKNSQLENRKFRRQHSIGNYILDFYCPKIRLAIELDGDYHNNTETILYEELKKLFPNIGREFKKEWCRDKNKLPYDFMIPELNIIIELDGSQHIKPNDFFGGKNHLNFKKNMIYIKKNVQIKIIFQ